MKALVCTRPGSFEYRDIPDPSPQPQRTIIKTKRVGICGTDLHAYEGTQPYFNYPRILGHELAAEIIQTDAPDFEPGEAVTIIPYFNCGVCIACRSGKPNCCVSLKVCGVHIDGGMAEYLSVPSSALVHADGLDLDELALAEPLAIGAHGVRRAAVKTGEFVLVIGAGPIGLGTMEFARIAGGKVIAMDVNQTRLAFCRDKIGIEYTVDARNDAASQLKDITHGDMPAVVIDATGNLNAINIGFQYLSHGGRYVLIGLQKGDINFGHPEFHKREATLMSSRNATRADFEEVMKALKEKLVDPLTYITHRVSFDQVKDEFPNWLKPENNVIKAVTELP
ncbi:MAG: zinc-binding alcohol dehydrogenase family protein [Bacteroidetes bacterium]|nr:zinc-binding alcohol dehydrogenase family protein [Bacteroidota bacterium]